MFHFFWLFYFILLQVSSDAKIEKQQTQVHIIINTTTNITTTFSFISAFLLLLIYNYFLIFSGGERS